MPDSILVDLEAQIKQKSPAGTEQEFPPPFGGDPAAIKSWPMYKAAEAYRARGFGVRFLQPNEKFPKTSKWSLCSQEPDDYQFNQNIALMAGRVSGDLVCVDLDDVEVLKLAPDFLPPTGMREGRPSKPNSHWHYRVTNIPPEMESTAAGGMGGPWTKHLKHAKTGKGIIDFLGTGAVVAVPPSRHPSGEERVWEADSEPATVDCAELWEAVCRLHVAAGGRLSGPRQDLSADQVYSPPGAEIAAGSEDERLPGPCVSYLDQVPMAERVAQCRVYLAKTDAAVSGEGGHGETWRLTRLVVNRPSSR